MDNQFDELAKGLAQSATRRQALKKFGVAAAGALLACFGLANSAEAGRKTCLPTGSPCSLLAPKECCSHVCHAIPESNIVVCG